MQKAFEDAGIPFTPEQLFQSAPGLEAVVREAAGASAALRERANWT